MKRRIAVAAGLAILLYLALAYLAQRPWLTALHAALLALGVATVVFLVLFNAQAAERLERDARGIDLVVGAKGSPLQLILAGMNVARLNFSHGDREEHRAWIKQLLDLSAPRGRPLAILQDLAGPKMRIASSRWCGR